MTVKILSISNNGSMVGGGEHAFAELLPMLAPRIEATAILPDKGELYARLQKKNIDTKIVSLPELRPWTVLKILKAIFTLIKISNQKKCQLIYANGSRPAFYASIIGLILSRPVIWHCRVPTVDKYLDNMLCRMVTGIIANSKSTAKRFHNKYSSKVTVIYNGIDLSKYKNSSGEKPIIIDKDWIVFLVVARVSKWKRHDLALSAFEKVANQYAKTHLICIGDRDKKDRQWWCHLQKQSNESKFKERIHWIGQVEDVSPWYAHADAIVLVSDNEAFGRVIVEAMAAGVPVIASDSGGIPEIIKQKVTGILVPPGEVGALASAMHDLISNKDQINKIRANARKRSEAFDLKTHVDKMLLYFERLFESSVKLKIN